MRNPWGVNDTPANLPRALSAAFSPVTEKAETIRDTLDASGSFTKSPACTLVSLLTLHFVSKAKAIVGLGISSSPASLGAYSINFPFAYTFLYPQVFLLDLSNYK